MKLSNNSLAWYRIFLIGCILLFTSAKIEDSISHKQVQTTKKGLVYIFEIRKEISKPALRITTEAFNEALKLGASYILIHLNTYGGRVDIADSIRTRILNSPIPVMIFIDNQAISAGALISIAADSIYMRPGGSIGAATVVDQTGQVVADKYQAFMRSTMRATAEAHGKDTIIKGTDTSYVWHRDPHIAEAMVDPRIVVEGIIDSTKVLSLTSDEAIAVGYCEGKVNSIEELLEKAGLQDYEIREFRISSINKIILFFMNPIMQSILILLIVGGIYFELQTPGIGFPLALAVCAALLYFVPLYFEGLAQNWEVIVFIIGIILLAVEIFVIPGFGVAGISGILLIITGLTMGLIDNAVFEFEGLGAFNRITKVFIRVIGTVIVSFVFALWISKKIGTTRMFSGIVLESDQDKSKGFVSIDTHQKEMIGRTGIAYTVLRPSGKVKIGDEIFDAKAEIGYIDKNMPVKVIRDEAGQLYVIKI